MQVASLERHVRASDVPPERLAGNSQLSEQDKVAEVSRQFEAILLRQILQQAQKPMVQSSLVKDSAAAGIYRDLTTQQLADCISKSGSFGLAQSLESQLSRQLRPHSSKPDAASGGAGHTLGRPPIHPMASAKPARLPAEHGAELLRAPRVPRARAQPIFPKTARLHE